MASIINADSGISSSVTGITFSADNSGALNIQTNGVTAIAISSSQAVSFPATTSLNFGSANITTLTSSSATITNLIATSASITTLTNNPTFGAGTANGMLYLNGSKVITSGSAVVFDGTNMGVGVTPSSWTTVFPAVQLGGAGTFFAAQGNSTPALYLGTNAHYNGTNWIYKVSNVATRYDQDTGVHRWYNAASGTAGNTITFTQAMTLDASSNLTVGTTNNFPSARIFAAGPINTDWSSSIALRYNVSGQTTSYWKGMSGTQIGLSQTARGLAIFNYDADSNQGICFYPNSYPGITSPPDPSARITSGGEFLFSTNQYNDGVAGTGIGTTGFCYHTASGIPCLTINRLTNDGDLIEFKQASALEGSISVSGNTVSYNAFAGSHWSQLQDGSKPDILRGTVMESINELCVWPDETNERLPKSKVSDTAGSKKVYGVFMAWDNDWTETNDMYVTAVGAFICRVNGSVTVQEGDLLESNGDGTARVQADDIIRSSTIGKVTSTVKTHQYADGSYCVPTVLYCG